MQMAVAVNLANALCAQGYYVNAAAMYRKTLEVQKRAIGKPRPHTLRTLQVPWACKGSTLRQR